MARPPINLLATPAWLATATLLAVLLGLGPTPAPAEVFVWVDEGGVTHITDDPSGVPAQARTPEQGFGDLWSSQVGGEPYRGLRWTPPKPASSA